MKKIILALLVMTLLITACTNTNGNNNNLNTDNENNNIITEDEVEEKTNAEDNIDRTEYLTGEIITDGVYNYPSKGFGIIYFVPDVESSEIIKEKFNVTGESLQIKYDDITKVENLPEELGIYKVKIKIELEEEYQWLVLNEIQLTDKIGTVLYEGKTYETNELDENVKVKDKVCGLIVKWISRDEHYDGIQIRFAGEIESEGYYFINYDLMYDVNMGKILAIFLFMAKWVLITFTLPRQMNCSMNYRTFLPLEKANLKLLTIY